MCGDYFFVAGICAAIEHRGACTEFISGSLTFTVVVVSAEMPEFLLTHKAKEETPCRNKKSYPL